ncbi:hypothetical protein JRO89_XS09G0048500 [Xanthoceras sorbifolium]|uniref:GAG-pre-integrase domain-containing protein n=1 Tax=Xanthoceras sorbifolium TaxID=99658 RepID=A0ABQ8HKR2_9ROSI|nr:hypothetical protein JRO89_XS09G0048500 [Xanthoceras sorbifolium]
MAGDDEQPPSPPPKREMNSPFFLGTGDRPGDFITPTRLRGDNYDDWASDIQLALEARRKREQGKLHDFLMGLNIDLYAQLRTNILSQDPLPSLDRAYQLVIQHERVRLAKAVTDDKPAEHGHDKNNCYEIVGYPEGWSNRNKADEGAGRSRRQAGRGRGSARANAAIPDDRLNGKFDMKSWIIDTGATHHVTGDLSWLFDTMVLFECPVGLPNGESVVATQSGSVGLSDKITLQNVLYDHTRELIGTGVRRDGLYYFGGAEGDSVQHVSVHNAASTLELWHKRMGHPSEKVVKLLPPVSNLKDLDLGLREGGQARTEASSAPQTEASSVPLSPRPKVVPTAGPHSPGLDNTSNGQSAPMGKGMRDKFPSVLLRDFVTHTVVAESPSPATPSPQHPSGK